MSKGRGHCRRVYTTDKCILPVDEVLSLHMPDYHTQGLALCSDLRCSYAKMVNENNVKGPMDACTFGVMQCSNERCGQGHRLADQKTLAAGETLVCDGVSDRNVLCMLQPCLAQTAHASVLCMAHALKSAAHICENTGQSLLVPHIRRAGESVIDMDLVRRNMLCKNCLGNGIRRMKFSEAGTTDISVDKYNPVETASTFAAGSRIFNRKPGHYLPLMHYAAMISSEMYIISMLAPILSESKMQAMRMAVCDGQWQGVDAIIGRNMSSYGYSAECIANTVSRARVQLPLVIKIYEHMIPSHIYTQVLPETFVTTHKYRERVLYAITDRMPVAPPPMSDITQPDEGNADTQPDECDTNTDNQLATSRWETSSILHFTMYQGVRRKNNRRYTRLNLGCKKLDNSLLGKRVCPEPDFAESTGAGVEQPAVSEAHAEETNTYAYAVFGMANAKPLAEELAAELDPVVVGTLQLCDTEAVANPLDTCMSPYVCMLPLSIADLCV